MFLLVYIFLFIMSCSSKQSGTLKMVSFDVVSDSDFEMCFNEKYEGNYKVIFVTKSGKEISKEGSLILSEDKEANFCSKNQKMQYSFRAYDATDTKFYKDSLTNENISFIKWELYDQDYQKPYAKGEFIKNDEK